MEEKLNTCLWHVHLQIVSKRKKERKSRGQHHAGDATASVTDAKWVEHERLLCARFFFQRRTPGIGWFVKLPV